MPRFNRIITIRDKPFPKYAWQCRHTGLSISIIAARCVECQGILSRLESCRANGTGRYFQCLGGTWRTVCVHTSPFLSNWTLSLNILTTLTPCLMSPS
ncbi:MAG: hypothetical protein JW720_07930 [Sedimentisphaerales bacterium]|nr:hypothetical protein [Sedimentisphaerales bacterium]